MTKVKFSFKAIFYITIIIGAIFLVVVQETPHNKCWNETRNECASDVYRIDPKEGDTVPDLIQRLWNYTHIDLEKVFWRRSLLYAGVATLVIFFIMEQRVPEPIEFIVSFLILYVLFYQMNTYYTMHYDFRSDTFARRTINVLRENLGFREATTAKDFSYI